MKTYLALIVACDLCILYSPAWAERHVAEPINIQSEPRMEEMELHKSPEKQHEESREIKMIMLNQQLNKKGNSVSQQTKKIKPGDNTTQQSIINNLK